MATLASSSAQSIQTDRVKAGDGRGEGHRTGRSDLGRHALGMEWEDLLARPLQYAFRTGDIASRHGDGVAEGTAKGLEDGLGDVMAVATVGNLDMAVESTVVGQGGEELLHEGGVEGADFCVGKGRVEDQGAAAR